MMRFKGICTAAVLVAAMTLAACGSGGGDSTESAGTPSGSTGATGTPRGPSGPGANTRTDRDRSGADTAGSGGSSAPRSSTGDGGGDSGDGAVSGDGAQSPGSRGQRPNPTPKAKSKPNNSDPIEAIENLSGAERKKLHADLYKQGETLCSAYGPAEVANSFNLPTTDPEQLAKLYAEKYEQATPSLVLPVQQGCLAGFKQWAKKNG